MTTDTLALARQQLLAPAGLGEDALHRTLSCLLGHAIDGGDLYFQQRRAESWGLEDGQVKNASHAIQQGVGVRATSGEKTGFAYSDEIVLPALLEAATAARAIARDGGDTRLQVWRSAQRPALYEPLDPLETLSADAKVSLLEAVDAEARRQDPRVTQVMVSLAAVRDTILIAGSDGTLAGDVRPLVRLNVSVIVEEDGRREQGGTGGGGRTGLDGLIDRTHWQGLAREALRIALVNLRAEAAPAGAMDVVLGPGWPGVLLHEAIGHGLEGDANRKRASVFAGLMGSESQGKMAQSETRMKGVLPELMDRFLAEKYGAGVRRKVMDEIGNPVFLAMDSYPDAVLGQMADLAAKFAGKTRREVLRDFGFFTPAGFKKLYGRFFKEKDLKKFLLAMNAIHDELTREMPGIKPPRFTYEDRGEVLVMTYSSSRALFDYFEGILGGTAALFGRKVQVAVTPVDRTTARAEIRFL